MTDVVGLKPLPPNFEEKRDPQSGKIYWVNHVTTKSQWENPRYNLQLYPLPAGFTQARDAQSGRTYWVNHGTKESTWNDPRGNPANYPLPADFEEKFDMKSGKKFWVNHTTKRSQWVDPRSLPAISSKQIYTKTDKRSPVDVVSHKAVNILAQKIGISDEKKVYNAVEDLKAWYKKQMAPSEKEYHNRSSWIGEVICSLVLTIISAVLFADALAKQVGWANILISAFVAFVFIVMPWVGRFIDSRYHNRHEMTTFKSDKVCECWCTFPILSCYFGFLFIKGPQLILTAIDVAFYIGPYFMIMILMTVLCCWTWDSDKMPTMKEILEAKLQSNFERRANNLNGKQYVNKFRGALKSLCGCGEEEEEEEEEEEDDEKINPKIKFFGCLLPESAFTWAKCLFIHFCFDVTLEVCADAWFLMRLFDVVFLCFFGGVENCFMQLVFCFNQRKRIAEFDYGAWEPESLMNVKLALSKKFDLPDLPKLRLPQLALDDLLVLLPDLPSLPGINMDFIEVNFPKLGDLPIDFPRFEGVAFGFPDNPTMNCCSNLTETIEEIFGTVMDILFAIHKVNTLTAKALKQKAKKNYKNNNKKGEIDLNEIKGCVMETRITE